MQLILIISQIIINSGKIEGYKTKISLPKPLPLGTGQSSLGLTSLKVHFYFWNISLSFYTFWNSTSFILVHQPIKTGFCHPKHFHGRFRTNLPRSPSGINLRELLRHLQSWSSKMFSLLLRRLDSLTLSLFNQKPFLLRHRRKHFDEYMIYHLHNPLLPFRHFHQ